MLGTVLRASDLGFDTSPWVITVATHTSQMRKMGPGDVKVSRRIRIQLILEPIDVLNLYTTTYIWLCHKPLRPKRHGYQQAGSLSEANYGPVCPAIQNQNNISILLLCTMPPLFFVAVKYLWNGEMKWVNLVLLPWRLWRLLEFLRHFTQNK